MHFDNQKNNSQLLTPHATLNMLRIELELKLFFFCNNKCIRVSHYEEISFQHIQPSASGRKHIHRVIYLECY